MIRFLADANLNHAIVSGCLRREPTIDFLSAKAARLDGLSDPEVLALAASQGRTLVTHDFRTMPIHFADFLQREGSTPGVILVSHRTPVADAIDALVLIWAASDTSDWENRVVEVPFH